jgi:glycosyltransferase involved in cell wall biosynthesis
MKKPVNVLVFYWWKETSKYTLELLHALRAVPNLKSVLSCSNSSEFYNAASSLDGLAIVPVTTHAGTKRSWRGKVSAMAGVISLPLTMLRFHRLLQTHQIDVAICAQGAIWDVVTIPLLVRGPVRYVQITRDVLAKPGEGYGLRNRVRFRQIAVVDGIVVVFSEQIKRQIIDRWNCPADRRWKMPHGSNTFGSQKAEPAVHPRGMCPILVLLFELTTPYKGLDRLLAAMQLLRERGLSFKLVIAGSGDSDSYRHQLDSPDVAEQVANFPVTSDLVVLPYNSSNRSGVAAAAYTAGHPVVATPAGGLMEQVLPSTGLLARDMSANAFADDFADLITDPISPLPQSPCDGY